METETQKELVCNCNAEFKVGPCPIHQKEKVKDYSHKTAPESIIITDADMVKTNPIRQWTGHAFVCPICKQESILYFSNHCSHCGQKIIIKSKIVTDRINSLGKS